MPVAGQVRNNAPVTPNAAAGFNPHALREARTKAGMSQDELAEAIGSGDRTSIFRWETGRRRPQIGTVVTMAAALGVPVSQLMGQPSTLPELRARAGLSQAQVAERLGVSRPRYTTFESGTARPNHEEVVILADAFGVDVDVLVGVLEQQ